MFSNSLYTGVLALALAALGVQAGYNSSKTNNLAVYWGQNSYGQNTQGNLSTYCASTSIDIIPIGFVTKFHGKGGYPEINLSNACIGYAMFRKSGLLSCPTIEADIKTCQTTYNKTILMSIAGDSYAEGGWKSVAAAQADADMAWNMFGAGSYKYRPFGNAIVDGFDLDFETPTPHLVDFAARIRSHLDTDESKTWMMTAAPQCSFPNTVLNSIIQAVYFDAIFVQFYNGLCGVNYWAKGKSQTAQGTEQSFDMQLWDNFAQNTARHNTVKQVKVFIGMPAHSSQANYVSSKQAAAIIADSARFASFAGVMLWDASEASANSGYATAIKKALNAYISKRDVEVEERAAEPVIAEIVEKRSPIVSRHHSHHRRNMI